jgi:hypothetical protein
LKIGISDDDLQHMQRFPEPRKAKLMQHIMSRRPENSVVLDRDIDFDRTLIRMRRDGFRLIDLKRHDTAFTTVWHRRRWKLFGRARAEVALLLWEMNGSGVVTTVSTWRM